MSRFGPAPTFTFSQLVEFASTGTLRWKASDRKRSTSGASKNNYRLTVRDGDFAVQLGLLSGDVAYTVLNDPGSKAKDGAKMWSVLIKIPDEDVAAAKALREWFYASIKAEGIVPGVDTIEAAKAVFRSPFEFASDPAPAGSTSTLPKENGVWVKWKVAGSASPTHFHEQTDSGLEMYPYNRIQRGNRVACVCSFWPLDEYEGKWSTNFVAEKVKLNSAECNHDAEYVPPPRAPGGAVRPPLCLPYQNAGVNGFVVWGGKDELEPAWYAPDDPILATCAKPLTIDETAAGVAEGRVKISSVSVTNKKTNVSKVKHYINYAERKGSMTTVLGDLQGSPDAQPYICFKPSKYMGPPSTSTTDAAAGGGSGTTAPAAAAEEPESKTLSMLVSFTDPAAVTSLRALRTNMVDLVLNTFDSPVIARQNAQELFDDDEEAIEKAVAKHIETKSANISMPVSDPRDMAADLTAKKKVKKLKDGRYVYAADETREVHFSASLRVSNPEEVPEPNGMPPRLTTVYQLSEQSEPFAVTKLDNETALIGGRSIVPVIEWRDISQKGKYNTPWFTLTTFALSNPRATFDFIEEPAAAPASTDAAVVDA